jgi:hypothetical protein
MDLNISGLFASPSPNKLLRLIHTCHAAPKPFPCYAVPLPCRAALIHTCYSAPLPFFVSALSFVKVRVVAGNIRIASPIVERICMLLIITFMVLRVIAGRSRTRGGRPHAVSG